jgi:3-oxoacyl-[acyl-carrier-protein] synthase-3
MTKIRAAITGVEGFVPEYILTNAELETMVDTNNEWIMSRTGVSERRILKGENLGTSDMAAEAVKKLLAKTNTKPEEIELIICSTVTPDMVFPATANIISDKVGLKNAWGYDLAAACSGFLFALTTGAQFIESGKHKKVIVVGADKMSSIVDYTDRATCVIFGDGAACVMLEPDETGNGIQDSILRTDGSGRHYLHQKAGGSLKPASHETVDKKEHFIFQDGQPVYKFAVTNMAEVSRQIMDRNGLTGNDVNWLAAHQANLRIIDATAKRMELDKDKVLINIEKYGNTTAGTIPLLLSDFEHKFKKNDNIILSTFGGGFTWGSIYLKWAY